MDKGNFYAVNNYFATSLIYHKVAICGHCGTDLQKVKAKKNYCRQVFDIPPLKVEVTEHRVEVKQCCVCGKETVAECEIPASVQYGEGVTSMAIYLNQYQLLPFERVSETMSDLFNCPISAEVIQQSNELAYERLEHTAENKIKTSVIKSQVMHNDETGIRCEGKTKWIHTYSTTEHTYYAIDDKRGKEAMERINILPQFKGISVHDRWASYDQYHCEHALCNAHLSRDLKLVHEEYDKPWAATMRTLLFKAYELSQQENLSVEAFTTIEKQYDKIVDEGINKESLFPTLCVVGTKKRGRKTKSESLKLLECFRNRKKEIMRFLHNKDVPFDNNLAERDLRMIKLKQKISGCFRTRKGAEIFCRIRSYISTMKKQGGHVWNAIQLTMKTPSLQLIPV